MKINIVEEINIENLFLKKISIADANFFLESLKEKNMITNSIEKNKKILE